MPGKPDFSFVFPVFNEEETLPALLDRVRSLAREIDGQSEFIFIDDGSTDSSLEILLQAHGEDPRVKVLTFSRNFGHQTAITAGMDLSSGDAIVIMDADLQDPPEVVLRMIEKWREGYEVVYAKRLTREGETWFKRMTASLFYRLLKGLSEVEIPVDTGDFRLVDRKALTAFNRLRESDRFIRGMFAWTGFRQAAVEYHRQERFAGETKYPLRKMARLAFTAILGFSDWPIRVAVAMGAGISGLAILYAVFVVVKILVTGQAGTGWGSMITVTAFLGGLQLMMIGIVGLYIGRIHQEVKRRPLYIVQRAVGFDEAPDPELAVVVSWS